MKYKLSEVMDIIGGGTPKTSKSEYWGGKIPWLSVKDFRNTNRYVYETEKTITEEGLNHSSTNLLCKDDIIISARGTVGEIAMIPFPMSFNQSCYGLRAKREILDNTFLYYLVKHNVGILKNNTHGSVFDTITRNTFEGIDVEIPSKNIQLKIAKILSDIDDKIELNNAINENLEKQAEAIFKSWFIDFEPFDGRMPDNWGKGSLIDIADYLNGLAMQKFRPKNNEIGLPVLKIKELRQGMCDSNSELCSPSIKKEYIINDGDVIFSWSGSLLVDFWCGGICGLNQHLFKVTSRTYDKWFYYLWIKYHLKKFANIAASMATTMGHIKRGELAKAAILIPSSKDYQKISSLFIPIYNSIITNRRENRLLAKLRDTLLPKLMSGEIDVSNIEL